MFERIFVHLFRLLYPSRFRAIYEKESRQLLHDRFRDETGPIRKARLCLDLLIDFTMGLPQTYRTTQSAAAAVPIRQNGSGIPSFDLLSRDKTGFGPLLLGATLSFTALVAFSFVLNNPPTYEPPYGPKSHITPIEAVMQRLNQAVPESTLISRKRASHVQATQAMTEPSHETPIPSSTAMSSKTANGLAETAAHRGVVVADSRGHGTVVWTSQTAASTESGTSVHAAQTISPRLSKALPQIRGQQGVATATGRSVAGKSVQSEIPASAILGVWQGTVGRSRRDMRIIAKFSHTESGALQVTFQRVGEKRQPISSALASFEGGRLRFEIQSINESYEGRMAADQMSVTGTWTHGARSQPLLLRRIGGKSGPL